MEEKKMSKMEMLIAVVICAVITFSLRALPFLLFQKGRKMPDKLVYLGKILPPAIMAVLVVYCMKDISGDFYQYGLPELVAAVVVAGSYKWKHNTLLSIMAGTACNMALLHIL
jgi:branched-subunit amino acid transport protein AzlD